MASNRVERLQMRQRGAGTRKIKEVDFGFSLFGPPAEESSQTASQPTNNFEPAPAPAPAPQPPPFDAPAPVETAVTEPIKSLPVPSPTGDNASSQEQNANRSRGSARNNLPPRPSTFDTAADDPLELGRSSKRRRIETPTQASLPRDTQRELNNGVAENRAFEEPIVPTRDEETTIPIRTSAPSTQNQAQDKGPSAETALTPAGGRHEDISQAPDVRPETNINKIPALTESNPVRANDTASPQPLDTAKSQGRGRGRKARSSPSKSDVSNPEHTEKENAQPTETLQERDARPEIELAETQKEKRGRARTPATQPSAVPTPTGGSPVEFADSGSFPKNETTRKGVRGRKRKNQEVTEKSASPRRAAEEPSANRVEKVAQAQDATVAPEPAGLPGDRPNGVDEGKKRAGRPKKRVTQSPEPTKESSRADTGRKRGEEPEASQEQEEQPESVMSRTAKGRKQREVPGPSAEQQEQAEPEGGASRADKRRKRKERGSERERQSEQEEQPEAEIEISQPVKRRKHRDRKEQQRDRRQQPTPEQEEPEPEPEVEQEPQADHEHSKGTKGQRGRRPANKAEEQSTEERTTAELSQPTKRKPRQPRGETVPVTVHRIVNAPSLGGDLGQAESASEDEAGSADEISSTQTSKLPTRGGVNPADVLAQICRETLEKTLATLKNGIENEANTARRQEWTLRRKAVEAFGTELESRLFELSEMLDSNFMLGVKVKKAKRNMMDLRARLDHVRREREAVALRMDAVRREHMIAEESRIARSTISHSLHNLDLVLERGQNRTGSKDESLTAGLEFRLRNVAQNVSSTASGAHGGILNQLKRFNAQLEETARQLEG